MSAFLIGVGFVFAAANCLLFLILVGKTLRASKPDWEQMRDDEEQASWLSCTCRGECQVDEPHGP